VFHLYHHTEVLNNPEVVAYDIGVAILKYGLTDEVQKGNPESEEEEELPEEKQDLIDLRDKQRKSTDPASRGKLPMLEGREPSQLSGEVPDFFDTGI